MFHKEPTPLSLNKNEGIVADAKQFACRVVSSSCLEYQPFFSES